MLIIKNNLCSLVYQKRKQKTSSSLLMFYYSFAKFITSHGSLFYGTAANTILGLFFSFYHRYGYGMEFPREYGSFVFELVYPIKLTVLF